MKTFKICDYLKSNPFFNKRDNQINREKLNELINRRILLKHTIPLLNWLFKESINRDEKYLFHFYENPILLTILKKERSDAKTKLKELSGKLQDLMEKIVPIEIQKEEYEKDLEEAEATKRPEIEDTIKELNTDIKALRRDIQKINFSMRDLQDVIEITGEALSKVAVFEKRIAQDENKIEKQGEINFTSEFIHMKKIFSDAYSPSVLKDMAEKVNISLRTNAIRKRERIKKREIASQSLFKRMTNYFAEENEIKEVKLNPAEIIDISEFEINNFTLEHFFGKSFFESKIKNLTSKETKSNAKPMSGYLLRKKDKELKAYAQALIDLQKTNSLIFLSMSNTLNDIKEEYKNLYFEIELFQYRVSNNLVKRVDELCRTYIQKRSKNENTSEQRNELNKEWIDILTLITEKTVDTALKQKSLELSFSNFETNFIRYGIITPEIFENPYFTELQKTKFSESFMDLELDKVDTLSVYYLDDEIKRWFLTQDIYETWKKKRGSSKKEFYSLKIKSLSKFRPALKEYKSLNKAKKIINSIIELTKKNISWNFFIWISNSIDEIKYYENVIKNSSLENSVKYLKLRNSIFVTLEKRLAKFISKYKKNNTTPPETILYLANYVNYNRQELQFIKKNGDKKDKEFINLRIAKANALDLFLTMLKKNIKDLEQNLKTNTNANNLRKFTFFDKDNKITKRLLGSYEELMDFNKSISALISKVETEIALKWESDETIKASTLAQIKTINNYNEYGKTFIPFPENISSSYTDFSLDKLKKFIKNFTLTTDPLLFTQIASDTTTNTIENKKFFPTYLNYRRKAKLQLPESLSARKNRLTLFHSKVNNKIEQLKNLLKIKNVEKIKTNINDIIEYIISGITLVDSPDLFKAVKALLETFKIPTVTTDENKIELIKKIEHSLYALFETRLYALTDFYKYNKTDIKKIVPSSKKNPTNADVVLGISSPRQFAIEKFGSKYAFKIENVVLSITFFKKRLTANLKFFENQIIKYKLGLITKSNLSKIRNSALSSFFDAAYYIKYYAESNPSRDVIGSMYYPLAYKLEEAARLNFDAITDKMSDGTPAQQSDLVLPIINYLKTFVKETFNLHPYVSEKLKEEGSFNKTEKFANSLKSSFFETLAIQTGLNNKKSNYIGSQITLLGDYFSQLNDFSDSNKNELCFITSQKLLAYAADICSEIYSKHYVIQNFNIKECAPPNLLVYPGNIEVADFYPTDDIDDEDLRKTKEYHHFMRDADNGNIWKFQMFPPRNINDFIIEPILKFRILCDKMTVTFRDNQGYLYKKFPKNLWHDKIIALKNASLIHKLLKIYYSSFDKNTPKIFTKDNTILPVKGKLERPVVNTKKLDDLHEYFNFITGLSDDKNSNSLSLTVDFILKKEKINDKS